MEFIKRIEIKLAGTNYVKTSSSPMNINIITLYWSFNNIILDILIDENECSLTYGQLSTSYVYDNDYIEVADDVSKTIIELLKAEK